MQDVRQAVQWEYTGGSAFRLDTEYVREYAAAVAGDLRDPELPHLTLADLNVVDEEQVFVDWNSKRRRFLLTVYIKPTKSTCGLASVLGLGTHFALQRAMRKVGPVRICVLLQPGSHVLEQQLNKQLADKERVRAAFENESLRAVIMKMVENE